MWEGRVWGGDSGGKFGNITLGNVGPRSVWSVSCWWDRWDRLGGVG